MDEAWIDMVFTADKLRMLPEYRPRYDDEVSDRVVDEDNVRTGLSTTILDAVIDRG